MHPESFCKLASGGFPNCIWTFFYSSLLDIHAVTWEWLKSWKCVLHIFQNTKFCVLKFSPVKEIASKFASADFQIFVGWYPKKVPKVPFFFSSEGTLVRDITPDYCCKLIDTICYATCKKSSNIGGPHKILITNAFFQICLGLLHFLWCLAKKRDFQKKHQNACGFAWEFLRSCKCYEPDRSLKRCGKLALEKKFFGWGVWIFCEWRQKWRTFRPPWPTLPGPGCQPVVFR